VELRTLRYFVSVADARSFSKASLHLRVAQPALSRQIQKLEDELGLPLFVRGGRHLELTEAGQLLLNRAHVLLRQVAITLEEVRASATGVSGTLAVGVSPATSELVAPLLMRECSSLYPKLRLDFVEGFSRLVFEQLINRVLSVCLIHNPPPHKAIHVRPLLVEAMYLVGPSARARASKVKPVTAKTKLDALPLILPNESHALRQLIEQAMGRGRLTVVAQTDGMITTRALVTAGAGYTILPYSAIHRQIANGELSARRLSDIDIQWTLSLACWNDQRSRAVAAICDILVAYFAGLRDGNKWGTVPGAGSGPAAAPRRRATKQR
jgi:LysR family transcriptional regulator, nitrogen assimilation regulatory protein